MCSMFYDMKFVHYGGELRRDAISAAKTKHDAHRIQLDGTKLCSRGTSSI